jgi:hypothetical protein
MDLNDLGVLLREDWREVTKSAKAQMAFFLLKLGA